MMTIAGWMSCYPSHLHLEWIFLPGSSMELRLMYCECWGCYLSLFVCPRPLLRTIKKHKFTRTLCDNLKQSNQLNIATLYEIKTRSKVVIRAVHLLKESLKYNVEIMPLKSKDRAPCGFLLWWVMSAINIKIGLIVSHVLYRPLHDRWVVLNVQIICTVSSIFWTADCLWEFSQKMQRSNCNKVISLFLGSKSIFFPNFFIANKSIEQSRWLRGMDVLSFSHSYSNLPTSDRLHDVALSQQTPADEALKSVPQLFHWHLNICLEPAVLQFRLFTDELKLSVPTL